MNFVEAMTAAQAGYDAWATKPHNAKWAKRIYHTPIPNDLLVNIAEAVCAATRSADVITSALKAKAEGWDAIADDMEALQAFAQGRALGGDRLIPWAINAINALEEAVTALQAVEVESFGDARERVEKNSTPWMWDDESKG